MVIYRLNNMTKKFWIIASIISIMALGALDIFTADLPLSICYLLPVFFSAWYVSGRFGVFICVLSWVSMCVDYPAITPRNSLARVYTDATMNAFFLLVVNHFVAAFKKNYDKVIALAQKDYLTGAFNRSKFFDLADYELKICRRYKRPITIAFIDIDDFKRTNDEFGHQVGDMLLCDVVTTIYANLRSTDILARFGGDEFVLLLPETGEEGARNVFTRLWNELASITERRKLPVTFSIGTVTFNNLSVSLEEMLKCADKKMYEAKISGKNQIIFESFVKPAYSPA